MLKLVDFAAFCTARVDKSRNSAAKAGECMWKDIFFIKESTVYLTNFNQLPTSTSTISTTYSSVWRSLFVCLHRVQCFLKYFFAHFCRFRESLIFLHRSHTDIYIEREKDTQRQIEQERERIFYFFEDQKVNTHYFLGD